MSAFNLNLGLDLDLDLYPKFTTFSSIFLYHEIHQNTPGAFCP
jgi:hypothetical protein